MKHLPYLLLVLIIQIYTQVQSQCSGGIWPIQNTTIGSFTISWKYNITSNTVQFIIQGQASSNINLTSTYIAFGWSNTVFAKNNIDMAMFFPGNQIVQDRYSDEHMIPVVDIQQDFCVIQSNITDQNVYVTFERSSITGDIYDVNFLSNVYLMFSMGTYTLLNGTNSFNVQPNFFSKSLETSVNFINCVSIGCLTTNCTTKTCSCLQDITLDTGNCTCFPSSSSSCKSDSTISAIISGSLISIEIVYHSIFFFLGSCHDQKDPCSSNGICLQTSPMQFICQCKPDYTGVLCQIPLFSADITIFNICQCVNGGICLSNGSCLCSEHYQGKFCQLTNPCQSNPCINGNCTKTTTGDFQCQCNNDYIGTRCDKKNSCLSNPCHQGTCIVSSNCVGQICNYSCLCPNGTTGRNCEIDINPCSSIPCKNNGTCIRNSNIENGVYRCNCSTGYFGKHCEYLNGCISSPCQNAGTCLLNNETNIPYCQCLSNTTGSRCETIQTLCTNTTCLNNGACFIDRSSNSSITHCLCTQGYTGNYCEISLLSINFCLQKPCGYNGTCIQTSNSSYYCICPDGLIGQSCSSNILKSCTSSTCRYPSTCQQIEDTNPPNYKCMCPDYLTGDRCQYTNTCQNKPCLNQGICIPLGSQNNFMCLCSSGFGHFDCSIYMGLSCSSNVCLNGGTCDHNSTNIQCICPVDFAGPRCEWTSVCSTNTCQNGGTCRQIAPTMAECLCQAGFTGPICSLRDSCATLPCKNGGGCTTLLADTGNNWSAYRCICPPGFYGQNCDTVINSCSNMVCPAYKICTEQSTGPVCICKGNKIGTLCQYDNPCNSSSLFNCHNEGICISSNSDPPISSCLCREGFTGAYCEILIESNPCASNPCQTRGYCALSTSNRTYTCICQDNFIGEQCERNNPCLSLPCLNQGVCQANWNQTDTWFTCRCSGTYTGNRCETSMLNPCGGLCMNGSPCNNEVCVCPAQYTGTFCEFDNPCYNPICEHDGVCSVISNTTNVSFTCTCSHLYSGQYCEIPLNISTNDSCPIECINGGTCENGICMCTSHYVGPACQYENPCIKQNPCLNGGTCFSRYNTNGTLSTQCFCLQGFTGSHCEATLCSPTSCNGGLCTATQNNIVCVCSTGKIGDRCQYADACATNPCLSTERCEQIGSQYQCISCFDKSSYCSIYQLRNEYCDNRYTILVDNNFLSVPQACQRSCGQCLPVQRLKDISTLFHDEILADDKKIMITTTTITNIQQEKCIDRRDDCLMQKAYGFCRIFNEKYPDDCIKTCHPKCTVHS
ncbi:unnamed protein product [Adineta steineri]|uniref:Neurogenic locus notch-like protein n=1 Tax=Adineta steineri TaxID=433720 RepID=A0A818ZXL5_9BILA|nr:unnamed protein product [Adineta steineri]